MNRTLSLLWRSCCLVAKLCLTLSQPHGLYVACQAPLFLGSPRQEYGSGLQFPPPGDFPNPWVKNFTSYIGGGFFTAELPEKPVTKIKKQSVSKVRNQIICRHSVWAGGASGKEHSCQHRRHKETRVQSLSWEDPLAKEMATYSGILAWKIRWAEKPGGLQS